MVTVKPLACTKGAGVAKSRSATIGLLLTTLLLGTTLSCTVAEVSAADCISLVPLDWPAAVLDGLVCIAYAMTVVLHIETLDMPD